MPKAHPMAIREEITTRHARGQSLEAIALDMSLSYSTVRALWRRYRDGGTEALAPRYYLCGSPESEYSATVQRAAIELRCEHRDWGAARILECLRAECPGESFPTARTLQRWFEAAGLARAKGRARNDQHG